MRRCIRCKQEKDESEFNTRSILKGYLQSVCRDCQQKDSRDRYASNPEGVKQGNRASRQKSKEQAQAFVDEYKASRGCTDCQRVSDPWLLTFDHVKGTKKANISDLFRGGYSLETIKKEIETCEVVCFNSHMERERKRR